MIYIRFDIWYFLLKQSSPQHSPRSDLCIDACVEVLFVHACVFLSRVKITTKWHVFIFPRGANKVIRKKANQWHFFSMVMICVKWSCNVVYSWLLCKQILPLIHNYLLLYMKPHNIKALVGSCALYLNLSDKNVLFYPCSVLPADRQLREQVGHGHGGAAAVPGHPGVHGAQQSGSLPQGGAGDHHRAAHPTSPRVRGPAVWKLTEIDSSLELSMSHTLWWMHFKP